MTTDAQIGRAARKRARYEVQLARDAKPAEYDEARFERMVRSVAANIINRGEDWREWAASEETTDG